MSTPPRDDSADGLIRLGQTEPLGPYLRDLWNRRDFIIQVPLNEMRVQNANTLLGNLWLILNPVLQVGVYFLVFGVIVDVRRGVDPYLVFLTIGVFVFHFSQRVITAGARAVQTNVGLIRSMRFPRAILPLGSSVSGVLSFAPVLLVMFAVAIAHGIWPSPRWLLLVPIFAAQVLFSAGGSFIVARLNHVYSDLENTLPFLFRLLFYMSGVLYAVDRFVTDPSLKRLFALNPLYDFLSIWRWAIMGMETPAEVWIGAAAWSIILPIGGFAFFRAAEATYGRAN